MTALHDDLTNGEPTGELVHWMAPKPLRLGLGGASVTAAGAFAMGVIAGAALLALIHLMKPEEKRPLGRFR